MTLLGNFFWGLSAWPRLKCDDTPLFNYDKRLTLLTTPRTEEWTRCWFPFNKRIKFPSMIRVIGIHCEMDGKIDKQIETELDTNMFKHICTKQIKIASSNLIASQTTTERETTNIKQGIHTAQIVNRSRSRNQHQDNKRTIISPP